MKQTLQQLEPIDVPLKNLLAWEGNVRTTQPDESIQELAASIEAVGLLHSLVVEPIQRGKYPVIAGKRRLLALSLLQQQGKITATYKVPCRLLPPGTDLTEISLTENIQREPMFPLDECASFQTLIENGKSIVDVAARFGYTEKTVQKRLALARLSPVLQDAFRAGSINLELLQAFTLTTDHQRQEQVWNGLPQWNRNPAHVRQLLSGGQIPATDPRVRFIGVPAYEAAGGAVARDLFHDEDGNGIYCSDAALLDRLATEKLEQTAHQVQAEGWRWVEIRLQTDYNTLGEFRRLEGKPLPLPEKLQKQRAKLERKQADLTEQLQNAPEDRDDDKLADLEEACNAVEEQIDALDSQRTYEFSRKVKANCGVIVSVGDHGQPQCWYGLLRKEDQAIFDKSKTPQNAHRPIPKVIRLGSLREICKELELSAGKAGSDVKAALQQNASAFITAKVSFRGNDGSEQRFEASFTRYSLRFYGQSLPDGIRADAVYIILNDEYWSLLNRAQFRPLDYGYMQQLTASAQRFYEIVSYKMFAALSQNRKQAKLRYSEYCTRAPQRRYLDGTQMRKQMYKIHLPHVRSAYLADVEYRGVTDEDGQPDWEILYVPGRKARAEYYAFTKNVRAGIKSRGEEAKLPALQVEDTALPLVSELTKRGISERKAKALVESLAESQPVRQQLLWADSVIASSRGSFRNPPGFYIHVLEDNIAPPPLPMQATARKPKPIVEAAMPDDDYRAYQAAIIDKHIREEIGTEVFEQMVADKARELKRTVGSLKPETIRQVSIATVRGMLLKKLPHVSASEFSTKRKAA